MKRLAVVLVGCALLAVVVGAAAAEVFVLSGGGRVTGELLNPDESPREKYIIKTTAGARLTLEPKQVKEVFATRPEELTYETMRPRYPDTVEGHWSLAEWCLRKRLLEQREKHLRRIIELDPDHAKARRALGYYQQDGHWVTRKEVMAKRGYKYYKGRYRTRQEIELLEQKRQTNVAEKEWFAKLKRWRGWLGGEKDGQARGAIRQINDPRAVAALVAALESDDAAAARLLYVETLARIGTPDAVKALAKRAIEDPIEEVRLTCLDYLEETKDPDVVAYFVGKLRAKSNPVVNLAAVALRRMGDPSAVGPLIDALITTHKFKVVTGGGSGSMSTTFGSGPGGSGAPGGSGLSMGGRPKIYKVPIKNQSVLDALVTLSGQNYTFDRRAWKYWHTSERKRPALDARRDRPRRVRATPTAVAVLGLPARRAPWLSLPARTASITMVDAPR